jgi:hypothetical protein
MSPAMSDSKNPGRELYLVVKNHSTSSCDEMHHDSAASTACLCNKLNSHQYNAQNQHLNEAELPSAADQPSPAYAASHALTASFPRTAYPEDLREVVAPTGLPPDAAGW